MKKSSGQTLLEVLVALAAVVIVLGAITTAVMLSLKQSVGSSSQTRAAQLSQEGLEMVKPQVQTVTEDTVACLGESGTLTPETDCDGRANLERVYRRTVSISSDPAQCATLKKVTVSVAWSDTICQPGVFCHVTPLTTCL